MGKPSIAIYLTNVTKKIMQKLLNLQRREEKQEQVQAESYKSTISHELRTPLGSTAFIVKKIIELITNTARPNDAKLYQAIKCA